jgi:hypothetical protein
LAQLNSQKRKNPPKKMKRRHYLALQEHQLGRSSEEQAFSDRQLSQQKEIKKIRKNLHSDLSLEA